MTPISKAFVEDNIPHTGQQIDLVQRKLVAKSASRPSRAGRKQSSQRILKQDKDQGWARTCTKAQSRTWPVTVLLVTRVLLAMGTNEHAGGAGHNWHNNSHRRRITSNARAKLPCVQCSQSSNCVGCCTIGRGRSAGELRAVITTCTAPSLLPAASRLLINTQRGSGLHQLCAV